MVLGVSPKEWALHMMHEETELDTLALIAIRNMLEVSIIYMCTFLYVAQYALSDKLF